MSIEEKVISIVSEVLGIESEKITSADTFDDLYIDSLDLVEIIIECEQEFGYPIKDDKVQNLKTVEDLVNLIKDLDNKDYLESTQADLQVDE
ncbi:acyl carrier protein [Intestinibacter bartlettii]|jgi:acyl carrier protein|uniref:acyl carrier protein n=1 Tax=Intestinibacter bartlettii TaxID=261299 RepID=UPI0039F45D6F